MYICTLLLKTINLEKTFYFLVKKLYLSGAFSRYSLQSFLLVTLSAFEVRFYKTKKDFHCYRG